MRLRNVTFSSWLHSHGEKAVKVRWLRELYPWPVLAQVDCDPKNRGRAQRITYDGAEYEVTLVCVQWQEDRGTFKYRLRIDSEGLGRHSRSFSDEYEMCGRPDGTFVTVWHTKTDEPLKKIARAFFNRRWENLRAYSFKCLPVSRFLAASVVSQAVQDAFKDIELMHYPRARLVGGVDPMFASGSGLWIGYRFFSEDAYAWARESAGGASRIIALYFADTKYQFKTDLPAEAEVRSIGGFDATELGGKYDDLVRVLLRGLELPEDLLDLEQLASIVMGRADPPSAPIREADAHEALAALKRPCISKPELRYQLAAAVVLNAWIEDERRLGFANRKKFYAFKQQVGELVKWAADAKLPGVVTWAEVVSKDPVLYVRVDDVDFSFHAIPGADAFLGRGDRALNWSGVRLKPIAPLVLAWARALRSL
jgi:hypothetical protein